MMNRFIAFLAIAMFLCVPLASSAGTTAYAIGPAPTASSTPSAVIDLNKATPEQKEKFYQDPKLKVAKLPLPAGFSIADFFKYNNEKEALVLSGPPRIQLAKSSYAGDFNGVSFQLTIDDKSDMVAAGDQSFKNVPKGSKVSWDGKFLSLILPEQADARGKKTQKALQLKGDGTAKVESDGKTVSLSGADIRMVYGEKGKEMSTITGKKATATLDTSNGRIVGDSGVQVRDNRFGVFTFQERSAALTLSDAEAKMEGKFLFDTKDNRHLEVGQTGSVGHYYPGKQEFMFDKKGLVIDRDLGIKGMQSDDGKPFYVGLKKGLESELRGKNAILIDSGMVTTPKKGAGKLTPNQRDALAKDIIDSSVLPDELKNKLSKLVDDSKGKSEVEKKALREKLKVEILKSVEDNPKLIVYLFQLDAFSKVSDKMKEELKKGTDPVSAFNKLSAEDQKTIKGVSPSIESILKEKFPQNQAAASGERAIVKLFGDVSGAYQSESKSWVDFESALKVSASNPTARALSIELTGSDGKVARIDGKGVHLLNDKVKIGALEWTKWSASSKPATPSPVVRAPKTSPESDEYKWNVRNYKSYGREAVSIVEDNEALKDFRDIFTPDGKPDVEKIKALQAKLNEGRDEGEKLTVDGKLGQNTLEALQEADASSADPSFKTSPAEPYIAQDKQDQKAQKSSPRTPSETLLAARVREMLAKEESGEITTEQYNDFINSLESSHPGLDINIDTGEINKFPGRPSPSAQAREKLGGSLLAELYLSNPKNRADIDAAAAIAEKIRTNPSSATLADMVELEERLRKATGSSKEAARIMLGITQGVGIDDKTVSIVKGALKMLSTEEGKKLLAPKPGSSSSPIEALQALGGSDKSEDNPVMRIYNGVIAMRTKLIAGVELSKAELDFIDAVRSPETKVILDSLNLPPELDKYKKVINDNIRTLQSVDISGLGQQGNPFGIARIKQTVEGSGNTLSSVPGNIKVTDVIVSGAMASSRVREASAAGMVQLLHMAQDGVVRIKDKDGPGDVIFRVNPSDPSRMIMEPVSSSSDYEDVVTINVDLKRVMPVGKTVFAYGDKAAADNALCSIGAALGNNPYLKDNAKTLGLLSEGATSALGASSGGGKPYSVENVNLLTGLKLKKVIPKLSIENLDQWARESSSSDQFIQKVKQATGTKRTVTDPALKQFYELAKKRKY